MTQIYSGIHNSTRGKNILFLLNAYNAKLIYMLPSHSLGFLPDKVVIKVKKSTLYLNSNIK